MSELKETARHWKAYACPDCRFVFRAESTREGEGIICTSCRRLLRVPSSGDLAPPLVPDNPHPDASEPAIGTKRRKSGTRSSKKKSADKQTWENERYRRRERRVGFPLWIAGASLLFVAALAGVFFFMNGGTKHMKLAEIPTEPVILKKSIVVPVVREADLPLEERNPARLLAEIRPIAEKFMAATSVDEILPYVRNAGVAESRMREFYPDGKIVAPMLSQLSEDAGLTIVGNVVAANVLTGQFEEKLLALYQEPSGFKVDWECWVGWSEMPWDEFVASRPKTSRVFRVNAYLVDYYNRGFLDETKWQSYRIESPDGKHSIFAYAEKDSVVEQLLHFPPDTQSRSLMLALKFREDADSSDQVEVERFVVDGWVESLEKP